MLTLKQSIAISAVVILIAAAAFLIWTDRKVLEPVITYKSVEFSPKTTIRENQSSNHLTDASADGTSLIGQESESVSEEHSDQLNSDFTEEDMWEFFDDLIGISGESEIVEDSEIDDAYIKSAFGFGAFPDVPSDFPRQDVWEYYWKLYDADQNAAKNYELINRVVIQLWKEGGRAPGGVLKRGKVYPLDDNTAYITWKTAYGPDGEVKRYISTLTTTPDIAHRYAESHFRNGLIPSGVNVVEHSSGGYNPYDFVNRHYND